MPMVDEAFSGQTVITTFEVTPGTCQDLVEELSRAYAEVIANCPGFLGWALHVNDAHTRVASYSQWDKREDFQAMLRDPEMRDRNRKLNDLCRSFEPVMYDVVVSA